MHKAQRLFRLQEIDLEIDQVRANLDGVLARLADNSEVLEAQTALHAEREKLLRAETQQRALEWEADDLRTKQRELEQKLYGGKVRNPKELTSLQHEVETLVAARSKVEDSALEALAEVEDLQTRERAAARTLALCEEARAAQVRELEAQQAALERDLGGLEDRRKSVVAGVTPDDLERYEHIRELRQGRAVALLERGMCQGCRIALSMKDQQRARVSQDLVLCANCSRILYVER